MIDRFSRTEMLLGPEAMQRIMQSTVAVFGVGGVGSYAVEALARTGVGRLVLVDHDVVSLSNINRQLVALDTTVGRPKVEVAKERIRQINPDCDVRIHRIFAAEETIPSLIPDECDYVVDAIDSVPSKLDLIVFCLERGYKVVSSMGAGNKLDPTRFLVCDISETHTCPLAKVVRRELRSRGITTGVKVVFSDEPPLPCHGEEDCEGRTRIVPGSVAFVPSVVGLIMAGEVVKDLAGPLMDRE